MTSSGPEGRKTHNRTYYEKNKEVVLARNMATKRAISAYLRTIKEENPCMDCETFYPFFVMQFDHVRGIKLANLSNVANRGWSLKKVQAEIDKCDLVCCNCHSIRTYYRSNPE